MIAVLDFIHAALSALALVVLAAGAAWFAYHATRPACTRCGTTVTTPDHLCLNCRHTERDNNTTGLATWWGGDAA